MFVGDKYEKICQYSYHIVYWSDRDKIDESLNTKGGFSRSEIGRILSIIKEHQIELMEAWNVYFSS